MHHVAIIFGTRPEAIKLAPVAHAIDKHPFLKATVLNTGQHDVLMPTIMDTFGVRVHEHLRTLTGGQTLGELGTKLLGTLTERLAVLRPELVIVQGDTLSAQMGAMAAFYLGIPVGHVEAGLRTYNPQAPFPEESSRRIISLMATLHFAPTFGAAANLKRERVSGFIEVTGNPVVDALLRIKSHLKAQPRRTGRYRMVATIHRRENHPYVDHIFQALAELAEDPETEVLLPVHANPVVKDAAARVLQPSRVRTLAPMDYMDWLGVMQTADLIISDSGGVQEEAPVLGIPLLVAREVTERPEVIKTRHAYLVGHQKNKITKMARAARARTLSFSEAESPFGRGDAGEQIARCVAQYFMNTAVEAVP